MKTKLEQTIKEVEDGGNVQVHADLKSENEALKNKVRALEQQQGRLQERVDQIQDESEVLRAKIQQLESQAVLMGKRLDQCGKERDDFEQKLRQIESKNVY